MSGDITREQLVTLLRGSSVTIPDMQDLMHHWPQGIHPEIEKLEEYVQKTLEWLVISGRSYIQGSSLNMSAAYLVPPRMRIDYRE